MIKSLKCDNELFKLVEFYPGLNLIIADMHKKSSGKDSRNGAGKSSLIEIIDFCLGANEEKEKGLLRKELENWTFTLEISLKGKMYFVSRNTTDNTRICIEGDFTNWIIQPSYSKKEDKYFLKIKEWVAVLGDLFFDIQPEETNESYVPTFRSLIRHFIRYGNEAFIDPLTYFKREQTWQVQVYNAFLLNLNWDYAIKFQQIKDAKKALDSLKKAAKQGLLKGFIGTTGELEAEKIALSDKINKIEEQLKSFRVHPQYYEIQAQADKLTKKIHEISNNLFLNEELLTRYQDNKLEEKDVNLEKVQKIYEKAGLIFEDKLVKNINEVIEFHKKLIENRSTYLETEISRLSRVIDTQKREIEKLSNERAKNLTILKTHNALEEQTKLQDRLMEQKQRLYEITNHIDNLKKIAQSSSQIKIQTEELIQKAKADLEERNNQKERAIKIFNEIAEYLYNESGSLSIDIDNSGYRFDTRIGKDQSSGRNSMKIFDYDFTILQIRSEINGMPDFLIHDSDIFDPVDERQVALALEYASNKTKEMGNQYICALNSDRIPDVKYFSEKFRDTFDDYVRLTLDDTEEGGLFGFRFN